MKNYKDQEILEGIIKNENQVLTYVYEKCKPLIENMIIKTGGDYSIAQDVFQEGMMVVIRKVTADGFELRCKFSTYLYSICKKIWIQEIRARQKSYADPEYIIDFVEDSENEIHYKTRMHAIFDKHFNQLSSKCQKILRLHFNSASTDEIMSIMGFRNAHYTMDRKYRCKKSLIKRIENDPEFKKLVNELKR